MRIDQLRRGKLELDDSTGDASLYLNVIENDVKVTYYRMKTFGSTFPEFLSNFEFLHASLSPKNNRESI